MPDSGLTAMLAKMEAALDANRESVDANRKSVADLDATIAQGNAILRHRKLLISATCALVALNVGLTIALAVFGFRLDETQRDAAVSNAYIRANTCNQNALFAQSIASSGNTVDLYRGLRPLLAESADPDSRAAVEFIDKAIAGLETNRELREDFLALTVDTAGRLDCPAGFVAPGGQGPSPS